MTAQVTLLNGLGVALASDSAVTFGGKVLNSSEKIFDLKAPHKLAVLTSGRADFMGFPWEVLLSAWSQTLDRPLISLVDYRESLYKFIRTVLPNSEELADQEKSYLRSSYWGPRGVVEAVRGCLGDVLIPHYEKLLAPEAMGLFMSNENWDDEFRHEMSALVTDDLIIAVQERLLLKAEERRGDYEPALGTKETLARVWIDKYWADIGRSPTDDLTSWPVIPGLDDMVSQMWSTFVIHADYEGETGLHFLGFGAQDLFPSGSGVFMHGVVEGTLVRRFEGESPSQASPRAFFFGQSDAIKNITSGEDALLIKTAVRTSQATLTDIYDRISAVMGDELESTREYIKQSLETDNLEDEMRKAGDEQRGKPFYRAIEMAPIVDLAEFAAQLVGVQAASAAMTQDNPSVGGPVDVAIITHRGGFEWIRHSK